MAAVAAAAAVQCHKRNVATVRNIAVVTSRFLSHLQRLVDVKVR